ncbi:MAG: hypothetical protein NZ954_00565 [Thermofilaceae archaeon]|nr:hypothetical protein [Thermofilaceae archaeon]MCX8180327.1 hypothetical protein [Thermofilaceae archaeon]MDW8003862.1 hypothetical protein [Thermofilaceae archaeon]
MKSVRGTVVEVVIDHRKLTYAEFIKIINDLGGRVLSRDGFWPQSRYKVVVPRKSVSALIKAVEDSQRNGAVS